MKWCGDTDVSCSTILPKKQILNCNDNHIGEGSIRELCNNTFGAADQFSALTVHANLDFSFAPPHYESLHGSGSLLSGKWATQDEMTGLLHNRSIRMLSVRTRPKNFRRDQANGLAQLKSARVSGVGLGALKVAVSQPLAFLRTKKLCVLFHGLFCNNEAIRERP